MKRKMVFVLVACALVAGVARAADSLDDALKKSELDYSLRLEKANAELIRTRERIAHEKAPYLKRMRAAEDRILAGESEVGRLETLQENEQEHRRKLVKDAELLHRNAAYFSTLTQDGLKAYADELAPGENTAVGDKITELQGAFADNTNVQSAKNALRGAEFLLDRVQLSLGGYTVSGHATWADKDAVVEGTFAFVGPESYFQADAGGAAGLVTQVRGEGIYPIATPVADWSQNDANAFFHHQTAPVPTDATSGKALRLKQTRGNVWAQVDRGGTVAYVILGVGVISVLLILQKIFDLVRMRIDRPDVMNGFLESVGDLGLARKRLDGLKTMTRELMTVALLSYDEPKPILEERLEAVLLRERLFFERRLPLLAVIATAAPLMGLLGTVIGMVRTFALITVFGTGNAGKLASGISEVLVTTELGLLVAIPTLIAHGILAQRIQKNLSLLERYALEFVTQREAKNVDSKEVLST